ncbi:hypothetical protein SISSUDRAFT_993382 [Sistotremastrum suecicum HHB10207 ss-3]|uniref:Uncharacterized protein n=1 Tax=Sistotremastrum suecicum HHB10207 ss-3 TaxID=1314776 RepID=A0A165YD43_9AGAM|nr:hypothetical protein SISSUDRAFT_993382 [Sistotremastrum suecicum HHB10207 ss-3]
MTRSSIGGGRNAFATTSRAGPITLGIRREDPERIWERRAPLTPDAVASLIQEENVRVLIQDCARRIFPTSEYIKAGAVVHDTLEPAHIVVGIKEVPLNEVLTSPVDGIPRTHLMFSHSAKGQAYNMPLLAKFVSLDDTSAASRLLPTLIDYELLTDDNGKRAIGFGYYAGVAGLIEGLVSSAHDHLSMGVASPFLQLPRPYSFRDMTQLHRALSEIGDRIATEGTPPAIGPFVIGVTGSGNVASGVLDTLKHLPIEICPADQLPALVSNTRDIKLTSIQVYVVHANPSTYLEHKNGLSYDRRDYYDNPNDYSSYFHEKIAPHLTVFVNGIGWKTGFPRLMTTSQLSHAVATSRKLYGPVRRLSVADITCDIEGGLEFVSHATKIDNPTFRTDNNVQVMSIDILPSELPLDASTHFSTKLQQYLKAVVRQYQSSREESSDSHIMQALARATIAKQGQLEPAYQWLSHHLNAVQAVDDKVLSSSEPHQNVLLLGSGMVAGPVVKEICSHPEMRLLVASNQLAEAERLIAPFENATAKFLDISDANQLQSLISEADVVISLLPISLHPIVAEHCIKLRKNLVNASYVSPEMKALHNRAVEAGIQILCEVGLDPGLDHCSALALLDHVKSQGYEPRSFISFCGGLPAPQFADVPLGYKFSWSPRGVLSAAQNSAAFRLNNKEYFIPGSDLLKSAFEQVPISKTLKLEGLPNRDSLPYAKEYNLDPGLRSLLRGTLRYPGFSSTMSGLKEIGFLDNSTLINPSRWSELPFKVLGSRSGSPVRDFASFISCLSDILPSYASDDVVNTLQWLDLLNPSADSHLPPMPDGPRTPLDYLTTILSYKLSYGPGEQDMVVLSHEVIASSKQACVNAPEMVFSSTVIEYGTTGTTAMAKTVGLPVALAALHMLKNKCEGLGVHTPATLRTVAEYLLVGAQRHGIYFKQSMRNSTTMNSSVESTLLVSESISK